MHRHQYEIECGRCGAIKVEPVTEQESKGIMDRTAPVYRACERCGKTTGWIISKSSPAALVNAAGDNSKIDFEEGNER